MKRLVLVVAIAVLGIVTPNDVAASSSLALSSGEITNIQLAVFIRLFEEHLREAETKTVVLFVGVGAGVDRPREPPADPPDAVLAQLRESGWNVRPVSQAAPLDKKVGVRAKDSEEAGLWFYAGRIEPIGESEVEVYGEFYRHGKSAGGAFYVLSKVDGVWRVDSRKSRWKS